MQISSTNSNFSISTFFEHKQYNQNLHQIGIFSYVNISTCGNLSRIVVSFRFRSIEFSKKRALPFFLAIELLTQRKCIVSLSQRNVQVWKIRQGMLVGSKVTLRREGLYDFIDTLSLTFPRVEKFQPTRNFINKSIKKVNNLSRKSEAAYSISLGELVLFYPIELGLGLHPDIQQVQIKFIYSSLSFEEQYFLLRYFKIPVF